MLPSFSSKLTLSFIASISSAFNFSAAVTFVSRLKSRSLFRDMPGMRATVNISFLSTFELSCCEEHELSSREHWKHLPAWEVYVRKTWDEIQRLYIGRILESMLHVGEVADDSPSSSLCIFIL